MDAAGFIGKIVANVAEGLIKRGNFGVKVHSVTEFDVVGMLSSLTGTPKPRVAVSGANVRKLAQASGYSGSLLTADLAVATGWRNDPNSKDPVIIVSVGEEERLGSFHRFKEIEDRAIYQAICDHAVGTVCPNEVLKRWWAVLRRKEVARHISVYRLALYWIYVAESKGQIPEASREGLFLLGLLPSRTVFDQSTPENLFRSFSRIRALTNRIEVISSPDRDRIGRVAEGAKPKEKQKFQETLGCILKYNRTGSDKDRAKLFFEDVSDLFEAKGGSTTTKSNAKVVPIERAGVEAILGGDDDVVADIAKKLHEAIEQFEQDETPIEPLDFGSDGGKAGVKIQSPLFKLLSRAVVPNVYGGIFGFSKDGSLDAALADIDNASFSGFTMAGDKSFESRLQKMVENGLIEPEIFEVWSRFVATRNVLADKNIPVAIAHSPIVTLSAASDLLQAGEDYLDAYTRLSDAIRSRYENVASVSPTGARQLCSQFMLLDVVVIETRDNVFGILSPLHPLHIWKHVRLSKQFRAQRLSLSSEQRKILAESAEKLPHFLTALFVPSGLLSRDQQLVLPESHQIATLPCYQLENPHYAGVEGQDRLLRIIRKFVALYPHSRRNLRFAVVDPPDLAGFLEEIAAEISAEELPIEGLHVSVWRTTDRPITVAGDDQQLETIATVFAAEELPRFSLDIKHGEALHRDVLTALEVDPVHVLAIFDPSQSKVGRVSAKDGGFVHPLVLPKEFKYDPFEDKLVITPAATGDLFDVYYSLQNRLNDSLTGSSFGISSALVSGFPAASDWLKVCTWLVIGDKSVDTMPSGGGQVISFEPGVRRDVVVLSASLTKFEREFDYHLRMANLDPTEAEVRELVHSSAELVGEGLLGLLRASRGE